MKEVHHKGPCIIRFFLYEMSGIIKSIENEVNLCFPIVWMGRAQMGYDSSTALEIYSKAQNFKWVNFVLRKLYTNKAVPTNQSRVLFCFVLLFEHTVYLSSLYIAIHINKQTQPSTLVGMVSFLVDYLINRKDDNMTSTRPSQLLESFKR